MHGKGYEKLMLGEISQTQKSTHCTFSHMKLKQVDLIEEENRIVFSRNYEGRKYGRKNGEETMVNRYESIGIGMVRWNA